MKKKTHTQEPKFMQELHKVRAKLAKEWQKMSPLQIIKSINASGSWLKGQLSSHSRV